MEKLARETGLKYDYYRQNFLEKRIKSRMIRLRLTTAQEYLQFITNHPEEIEKFLNGFTINVTNFFRNIEVFAKIQSLFLECANHRKSYFLNRKNAFHSDETNDSSNRNISQDESNKWKYANELKNYLISSDIQRNRNILEKAKQRDSTKINSNLTSSESSLRNTKDLNSLIDQLSMFRKIKRSENGQPKLKIWSCACASGEEPYSIAILLDQLNNRMPNFPSSEIIASDIDSESLNKAKTGLYGEESMKEIPQDLIGKYFKRYDGQFGNKYLLSDYIKSKVEFIQEDVIRGHSKPTKYDIIFCRYFFIYIDRDSRERILRTFEKHLNPGGLLVLGKTETLFNSYKIFKLVDTKNHIYFKNSTYNPD